ncbi:MAG: hypothetical protein EOM80_13890 [Erysipelotrichia bacterium]|nr:hypothetical protein [Erysipelotrichia bacterium]
MSRKSSRRPARAGNIFKHFERDVSKVADVEVKIIGGDVFINLRPKLRKDSGEDPRGGRDAN